MKIKKPDPCVHVNLTAIHSFADRRMEWLALVKKFIKMVEKEHTKELSKQVLHCNPDPEGPLKDMAKCQYTPARWEALEQLTAVKAPLYFYLRDHDHMRKGRKFQALNLDLHAMCSMLEHLPITVSGREHYQDNFVYYLRISMSRSIFKSVQTQGFITLLNEMAQVMGAVCGWVDFSVAPNAATYGTEAMRFSVPRAPGTIRKQVEYGVPGYFWRQLLTQNHIQALGGLDRVKREAPCSTVEETVIGGNAAVWLQLNDDLFGATTEERLRMKEYLWPLLQTNYAWLARHLTEGRIADLTVLTPSEQAIMDELLRLPEDELSRR